MRSFLFKWIINIWPPFWGSGISVKTVSRDFRFVEVRLKARFFNRNWVGTHYGGSLYSMTDAFYMIMLLENLGKEFIVWDKAAKINFVKPGKGTVVAKFHLTQFQIDEVRSRAVELEKYVFDIPVQVVSQASGEVVAEVVKTLYVRHKKADKAYIAQSAKF